jgi:hypothetical protein
MRNLISLVEEEDETGFLLLSGGLVGLGREGGVRGIFCVRGAPLTPSASTDASNC